MPVQNDSIIHCIKYTKPQKEQKFAHIYLVKLQEKNPVKEHKTKLENEVTNRQVKSKPVLTEEEKKENKNTFPTATSIIVLRIQIALCKLPHIKLTYYTVK